MEVGGYMLCRLVRELGRGSAYVVKAYREGGVVVDFLVDGRPLLGLVNLEARGPGVYTVDGVKVVVEPLRPTVVLHGRGRVADSLRAIFQLMGWGVVEARSQEGAAFVRGGILIIATEGGLPDDLEVMLWGLREGAELIELLASRRRAAYFLTKAVEAGFPVEELRRRVATPAGVDIGAYTAEEVALSIAAHVVAYLRQGTLRPMAQVKDPYPLLGKVEAEEKCEWRG